MPEAFAETDCAVLENSGRTVHEFNLEGYSVASQSWAAKPTMP